jgi:hypothetical protein
MSQHGRYSYKGGSAFLVEPLDEKEMGFLEQTRQKPRIPARAKVTLPQPHSAFHVMADLAAFVAFDAARLTNNAKSAVEMFDREFSLLYHGPQMNSLLNMYRAADLASKDQSNSIPDHYVGASGFKPEYKDSEHPEQDQTHHFSAHLSLGINGRSITNFVRNVRDNQGDANLGQAAHEMGAGLKAAADNNKVSDLISVGYRIRNKFCGDGGRGLTYQEYRPIRTDILGR